MRERVMALEGAAGRCVVCRRRWWHIDALLQRPVQGFIRILWYWDWREPAVNNHGGSLAGPRTTPSLGFNIVVRRRHRCLMPPGESPRPLAQVREEALLLAAWWRCKTGVPIQCTLCLLPVQLGVMVSARIDRQLAPNLLRRLLFGLGVPLSSVDVCIVVGWCPCLCGHSV